MWSGPRTISTALMRAWENRPDTVVIDEPLYGFYLARTGIAHPGRDEIIQTMRKRMARGHRRAHAGPAAGREDRVLRQAHDAPPAAGGGPRRAGRAAARLPHPRSAAAARVLRPGAGPAGAGRPWPARSRWRSSGRSAARCWTRPTSCASPSRRCVLSAPPWTSPFDPAMLSWPAGPRDTDGVWAPHWYDGVWRSTGFGPYRPEPAELPPELEPLAERCRPFYEECPPPLPAVLATLASPRRSGPAARPTMAEPHARQGPVLQVRRTQP